MRDSLLTQSDYANLDAVTPQIHFGFDTNRGSGCLHDGQVKHQYSSYSSRLQRSSYCSFPTFDAMTLDSSLVAV